MVVNRTLPQVLSRSSVQGDRATASTLEPSNAVSTAEIQQLVRNVFADVKDIENFYDINFSRTRVRLADAPARPTLTRCCCLRSVVLEST